MDETLMPEDFSGVGTYQYNPRAKPKSYAELAAAVQGKMKGAAPAAPAGAPAPAAPPVGNPAPVGAPAAAAVGGNTPGMMGFGDVMQSPEAWQAGADLATLRSDGANQNMMKMGEGKAVPYGGELSWAEALNNGVKQGIGMYDYLSSQKAKANALRKFEGLFNKRADQQKEAELFSPGRGSGQHSVQGNPDYVDDL